MDQTDLAREAREKPPRGLRGERDLRNQDERAFSLCQHFLDGFHIDLGLA